MKDNNTKVLEEFKKGINTDNISDPPSDTGWLVNFLDKALTQADQAGYVRGLEKARIGEPDLYLDTSEEYQQGWIDCNEAWIGHIEFLTSELEAKGKDDENN